MCLDIFFPTWRRLVVFLFFVAVSFSGVVGSVLTLWPLQLFAALPLYLLGGASGIVVQLVYSYVVACIYAAAYVGLERRIRKRYPHINDVVNKKRKR